MVSISNDNLDIIDIKVVREGTRAVDMYGRCMVSISNDNLDIIDI